MEELRTQIKIIIEEILSNKISLGISNRHIHLDQNILEQLFGKEYKLKKLRDLSQPGYYAAQELVTIIGPKGKIDNVRILGPTRKETQVEISITDSLKLGVAGLLRESGKLENTPGIILAGPKGEVTITRGVIVAKRHIHMPTWYAKLNHFKNGEIVNVQIDGERGATLSEVVIRVAPNVILEMHVDTDEANGIGINNSSLGKIIR